MDLPSIHLLILFTVKKGPIMKKHSIKNNIGIIFIMLIFTFSIMSVSHAVWKDEINIHGTITTSEWATPSVCLRAQFDRIDITLQPVSTDIQRSFNQTNNQYFILTYKINNSLPYLDSLLLTESLASIVHIEQIYFISHGNCVYKQEYISNDDTKEIVIWSIDSLNKDEQAELILLVTLEDLVSETHESNKQHISLTSGISFSANYENEAIALHSKGLNLRIAWFTSAETQQINPIFPVISPWVCFKDSSITPSVSPVISCGI